MLRRLLVILVTLTAILAAPAARANDDWSLNKLVPFKKSSSARKKASVSDSGPLGLPKMSLPTWNKKSRSTKTSAWSSLTKKSQQMWKDTKDALTPGKPSKGKRRSSSQKSWWKNPLAGMF